MSATSLERATKLQRAFIASHLVLLLLPAIAGASDAALGTALLAPDLDRSQAATAMLDSTLRFYGGFWIGVAAWVVWLLRDVPSRGRQIEMFWGMIFLGGVGRVIGFVTFGRPPLPFLLFAAIELLGPPIFVLWHRRAWPRTLVNLA